MKITNIDLKRYEIDLAMPLTIKGKAIDRRSGIILSIIETSGHVGYGEAAPLPGLHKESIDEVISELLLLRDDLCGMEIVTDFFEFKEIAWRDLSSTAKVAVETALLDLSVQRDRSFINPANSNIPVNALITSETEDIETEVARLIENGYTTIKIKVAQRSVEEEIGLIKRLTKRTGGKVLFRLDANRGWDLDRALDFCECVGSEQIEYIEEPVKNIADQTEFIERSKIPIALDETLTQGELGHIAELNRIKAFVLKPGVLGGLGETCRLIRIAQKNDITSVLSSAFETSVGIRAYLCFAIRMGVSNTAVGMDTLKWLNQDTLVNGIDIVDGKIDVLKLIQQRSGLRTELLTDV